MNRVGQSPLGAVVVHPAQLLEQLAVLGPVLLSLNVDKCGKVERGVVAYIFVVRFFRDCDEIICNSLVYRGLVFERCDEWANV